MNTLNRSAIFDLDRLFRNQAPTYRYSTAEKPKASDVVEKPRVDISDIGESYELVAELPGIDKSNIFVTIEESDLIIETKSAAKEAEDNKPLNIRQERYSGNYKRSFNLGENVDHSSIKAQFKDGLLILTIAKKKEVVQKPTTIEIH